MLAAELTTSRTKPHKREVLARGAAALSIATAMTLGVVLNAGPAARAQEASVGSMAASIAPDSTIIYAGLTLDTTSEQWTLADTLLTRAGLGDGLSSLVDDTVSDAGVGDIEGEAFLGGEAGLVVTSLDTAADQASGVGDIVGGIDVPTPEATTDAAAGIALVLKPSDLDAAAAQLDLDLTTTAAESLSTVETTIYNGTEIKSVAGDDTTGEAGTAFAVVGEFLVISETPADIEPMIDTAAGTIPALSDNENFKKVDAALSGDRLAFLFSNGEALASSIEDLDTSGLGLGGALNGVFGSTLTSGTSIIADPAGLRINTVEVPLDGSSLENGGSGADLSLAGKVPANTAVYVNGFELGKTTLIEGLGLIIASAFVGQLDSGSDMSATPVAMPSADEMYAQMATLLGFNLKTGLLDQLTGEYGFALWNVDLEDPTQISAVLVSDAADSAAISDSLSKLSFLVQAAGQGMATVTTETVGGGTVNTVTIGEEGATPIKIQYGVVDGEFVLSVGGGLDGYVAGSEQTLADSEAYQKALSLLPSEYDGVVYLDAAQAIGLVEELNAMDMGGFADASEACGQYSTQAAAQEAYDADTIGMFDLDMDFDGQACEDYFAPATPEATTPAVSPYAAITSFATVSYKADGLGFTNSILVIEGE